VIVLVVSAFLAAGILVGRWWFVAVPLVLWPLWYLASDLVGAGLGDAWWVGFLVVTAASVALAALGVFVRRQGFGYRPRSGRPPSGLSA
jgi:hypothetical protein